MTAKIFSKDLRLAAHPMMYVFALFGVMLIIPNYPYTVVFFYGLLGIFFTFLNGSENKDVDYCAVLPVTKRDQVRARAWLVEALSHFPVVGPYLDATDAAGQVRQLPVLAVGLAAFALLSWLAYRKAAKNYERVDL